MGYYAMELHSNYGYFPHIFKELRHHYDKLWGILKITQKKHMFFPKITGRLRVIQIFITDELLTSYAYGITV